MSDTTEEAKKRGVLRGMGRTLRRGQIWWIAYYFNGTEIRESAKSTAEADARRLLRKRLKEIHGSRFVGPQEEKLTVNDLLDSLITHLETKGAKTVVRLKSHLKPLREWFALTRAVNVTTADVERYVADRLKAGKARATVNRETGALKQALNLARKQARLTRVPYIPMMREENARQGFFEHADFENFVAHLADPINEVARFAYLSGWRKGEILPLRWDAVERQAREVRLRTSKNGQGRVLPLAGPLWDLIERRWNSRIVQKNDGTTKLSQFVFHREGEQVIEFRAAWRNAARKSHVHGKLFHDLRRTAVRNMIRADVGQSVAMSISGHKTVSMFNRYNITSAADKIEALRKTAQHLSGQPTQRSDGAVLEMPNAKAAAGK
jgi:integrase